MPHTAFLTSRSRESNAREEWASAVSLVDQRTADYLISVLPDLEPNQAGDETDWTHLTLNRPDGGLLSVEVSPKSASLHGTGLHWVIWCDLLDTLYDERPHFVLVDSDGAETDQPRAAAPGSYTHLSEGDTLIVREDGTADVNLFGCSIDFTAQILAAYRDALTELGQQQCTRCDTPYWRHSGRMGSARSVCDAFTLACTNCVHQANAFLCDQARTGRPCTRSAAVDETHQLPQNGEEMLACLLEEFNGWDLSSLGHSAVELFGEHGDPNDVLSTSQKETLERAAVFFDKLSEPPE